jgi:hypothetical protein
MRTILDKELPHKVIDGLMKYYDVSFVVGETYKMEFGKIPILDKWRIDIAKRRKRKKTGNAKFTTEQLREIMEEEIHIKFV